jgi:hypothetical protein
MVIMVTEYIACGFLAVLALIILWRIWTDEINLNGVLSEANGQASMSRLQLLIFTFVIAISLFALTERNGHDFPAVPDGVLILLGISGSTYAVGKGISYSRDEGVVPPDDLAVARAAAAAAPVVVPPPPAPVAAAPVIVQAPASAPAATVVVQTPEQ